MALIVDDAQLLRMVAEPPRDAVPALARPWAFTPIVWLLAAVPPIVMVTRASFDPDTAAWAVRSLAVAQAEHLDEWLRPGVNFGVSELASQPPLQAWLTAFAIRVGLPAAIAPAVIVSAIASSLSLLLLYVWLREALGERIAVLGAVMWGLHPQFLLLAGTGRPEALSIALLLCVAWGLWGHWRNESTFVSLRLLCAGLAWGLALLAGGPLAVAVIVVLGVAFVWESSRIWLDSSDGVTRQLGRGTVLIVVTGGTLSLWWLAMAFADGGPEFFDSWLRMAPSRALLPDAESVTPRRVLRDLEPWLGRSAFLAGWFLVGLRRAIQPSPTDSATSQSLARWMAVWLTIGVGLRIVPEVLPSLWPAATRPWEAFLLAPTVVLAAQGLEAVMRRQVSNREFVGALTVTVAAVVGVLTGKWTIGLIVAATFAALIFASAPMAIGLRRASLAWTETGIRKWMQVAALATLLGPLVFHAIGLSQPLTARSRYGTLRAKLLAVGVVNRISLITDTRDAPQELEFLLRSLWPDAPFSKSVGWDARLTDTIVREANQPRSRMLIVEWSRKESRLRSDVGNVWQITPLMEPMAYGQRRLAVQLVAPAEPAAVTGL